MDLFIDLFKARKLNTSKLTKKPIMVRGKDGKIFRRMQWVNPLTGQETTESGKTKKDALDKKPKGDKGALDSNVALTLNVSERAYKMLEDREKFSSLNAIDKNFLLIDYLINDWEGAKALCERLGHEGTSFSVVRGWLSDHFNEIPLDTLEKHYHSEPRGQFVAPIPEPADRGPRVPSLSLDETRVKLKEYLSNLDSSETEDFLNAAVYTDGKRLEDMAQYYAEEHPKEARAEVSRILRALGDHERVPGDRVGRFLMNHYDDLNKDMLVDMVSYLPDPSKNTPKLFPAPISIRHTDNTFSSWEVNNRCGGVGPLDLPELTEGTPLSVKAYMGGVSIEDTLSGITPDHYIKNIFKGTTKEGLEHVFSGKNFYAELSDFGIYNNWDTDPATMQADMTFELTNHDEEPIGTVIRTIYRDSKGILNVHNEIFTLTEQGTGIATELYERSEQYWKYLSDGNPVNVDMLANISIGVYVWAKKGFDFKDEKELDAARTELRTFLDANGLDEEKVLSQCGYDSVYELEHSWQFAALDDGTNYNLQRMDVTNEARYAYLDEVHGYKYNLGKAFMLGGKSDWQGLKVLNDGMDSDRIWDIHQNSL